MRQRPAVSSRNTFNTPGVAAGGVETIKALFQAQNKK